MLGTGQGSASLSLGVRVFLKDQFSGPTRNITKALKGYQKELLSFQENLKVARNISVGIAGAGMVMLRGMQQAIKEGAQFLYTMQGVRAITGAVAEKIKEVSALAIKLGRATMFTPEQVASGMRFMAMAGQTANQIKASMPAATALAGATMTALGGKMGASDILTNALKAFGWQAKNSSQMADILTAAATSANVSLIDLGNSIRYAAATARNLNIPVQRVTANLMVLGNAGIQGSMAGTALENAYRYLANSLSQFAMSKAKKSWKMLGMSKKDVLDAKGNLLPLVDVLDKMRNKLKSFTSVDTQNILKNIFGVRGQRAAATLLKNLQQARDFTRKLIGHGIEGTATRKLNLMMDSVEGGILKLTSAWQGLRVAFTQAMGPLVKTVLHILTSIVGGITKLMSTRVGKFLTNVGVIFVAMITPIATLVGAIIAFSHAVTALNVSTASVRASMGFLGPWIIGGGRGARSEQPMGGSNYTRPPYRYTPPAVFGNMASFTRRGHATVQRRSVKGTFMKAPRLVLALEKTTKAVSMGARISGRLSSIGRGIMGFLGGPVGLAIMAISFLLPLAIDIFSDNSNATKENTKALLSEQQHLSSLRDLYTALSQKTLQQSVELIRTNLETAFKDNKLSLTNVQQLLQDSNGDKLTPWLSGGDKPATTFIPE